MAFMRIADFTGSIEVVVFPSILKKYQDVLNVDMCVAVQGRFSSRNDTPSVIAENIKVL
jgi:DNA polymerase-3 subunit alpha